ncbi:MAG: DUF3488 and transglutaminase-like domain-containing protein [bacterium]
MYFRLARRRGYSAGEVSELVLFFIIACAFGSVLASGEALVSETVIILLFFICAPFFQERLRKISGRIWTGLIVAGLVYSVFFAFLPAAGFESYFHGLLKFLILVTFIQYFNRRKARDELVLLLLALLLVSASTILTVSMSFLALLFVFVGLVITFLMIRSVRDAAAEVFEHDRSLREKELSAQGPQREETVRQTEARVSLPGRFLRFPWLSALVILLVGGMIFLLVPRVGRGLFAWRTGIHSRVSGYSERVDFGSVGDLMMDDSLAMRVKLEGVSGSGPFYFRGNALNHYTGRGWRDTLGAWKYLHFGRQDTISIEKIDSLDKVIKQEVILEPSNSDLLFAMPELKTISRPRRFRSLLLYWNDYVGLPYGGGVNDRHTYKAWSVPSPRTREDCEKAYQGAVELKLEQGMQLYLQLPEGMERMESLASRVTEEQETVCGKIFALRDFFREEFEYDLDSPSERAPDPISHFLFESRRGYCEYFATAMALMLRSQGIPCRLAAGYLTQDYNPIQGYYRVKGNSAHTWVEVYLPDRDDWLLVDPTPAGQSSSPVPSLLNWLRDLRDAVQYQWDRYVIGLGLREQYMMALRARDGTAEAGRTLARLPSYILGAFRDLLSSRLLVYVAAFFAAGYAAWLFLSRRKGRRGHEKEMDALKKEYKKLLALLAKRGIKRGVQETPLELAQRAEKTGRGFAPELRRATDLYLLVRFGGSRDKAPTFAAISKAMASLRRRD